MTDLGTPSSGSYECKGVVGSNLCRSASILGDPVVYLPPAIPKNLNFPGK